MLSGFESDRVTSLEEADDITFSLLHDSVNETMTKAIASMLAREFILSCPGWGCAIAAHAYTIKYVPSGC